MDPSTKGVFPRPRAVGHHDRAGRRWVAAGDVGRITFDDAYGWLDLDPRSVRRAVLSSHGARAGRRRLYRLTVAAT